MSRWRSDWLFLTLRGLALLILGWAFGVLFGLTSLGALALFLPVSRVLLGYSPQRASTAGWLTMLAANVGAVVFFALPLLVHWWVVVMWLPYLMAGMLAQGIFPRRWKISMQVYLTMVLMAVGIGMAWQAYPTLAEGIFRAPGGEWASIPAHRWKIVFGSAVLAGVVGGATGLGGGYVLVPSLVLGGILPYQALWLSYWLMLPLAALSCVFSVRRSVPSWSQEGWLAAGAFLGGVGGATWAASFSDGMLVACFGTALAILALITWRSLVAVERPTSPGDG